VRGAAVVIVVRVGGGCRNVNNVVFPNWRWNVWPKLLAASLARLETRNCCLRQSKQSATGAFAGMADVLQDPLRCQDVGAACFG
jgi:hypothetical protein